MGGGINWLLGWHDRRGLVPAAVTLPRPPFPINMLPPLLGGRWVLDQSQVRAEGATNRAEGGTDGGGTPLSTWTGTPFSCFQTYNSRLLTRSDRCAL